MGLTTSPPPEGEPAGDLRCPCCGGRDQLRLITDVPCSRRVLGVAHGFVEVDRAIHIDLYEFGTNFRFECRAREGNDPCDHRWPVPDWLIARLVFYC